MLKIQKAMIVYYYPHLRILNIFHECIHYLCSNRVLRQRRCPAYGKQLSWHSQLSLIPIRVGIMHQNQFDEVMAHYHSIALERYHVIETRKGLCRYDHDEDTYKRGRWYGCADTWESLNETNETNEFSGITQ
eukprot:Awhi_evm1s5329